MGKFKNNKFLVSKILIMLLNNKNKIERKIRIESKELIIYLKINLKVI